TAEASLRQFLSEHPNDPLVSDARFWLGESLFVRGSFREAANEFLESYSKFPQSAKAPDSLLKLGLSLHELGETEAACATYAELVRKYPAASSPVKQRVRDERKSAKCI
ncbi:MAG: tol-pal system protein YbgF, partial [Hyphomicrobiales bacterium]